MSICSKPRTLWSVSSSYILTSYSVKQYKRQFQKWDEDHKRIKATEYKAMIRKKWQHQKYGCEEITFQLRGRKVDDTKLLDFKSRIRLANQSSFMTTVSEQPFIRCSLNSKTQVQRRLQTWFASHLHRSHVAPISGLSNGSTHTRTTWICPRPGPQRYRGMICPVCYVPLSSQWIIMQLIVSAQRFPAILKTTRGTAWTVK